MRRLLLVTVSVLGSVPVLAIEGAPSPPKVQEAKDLDVEALFRVLGGADKEAIAQARESLGTILPGEVQLVPALRRGLQDPKVVVVRAACAGLSLIGRDAVPAVPDLLALLKSPNLNLKVSAAEALVAIRASNEEIASVVEGTLAERDPWIRLRAAGCLVDIGRTGPGTVAVLIGFLEDPDANRRETAAQAIGNAGPAARGAVPDLLRHLEEDPEMDVRFACQLAVTAVDPWLEGLVYEIVVRREGQDSMGVGGGAGGILESRDVVARKLKILEGLKVALADASPEVRGRAVELAGLLLPRRAPIDLLVKAMGDASPVVRCAALEALDGRSTLDDKAVIQAFQAASKDTDPAVQAKLLALLEGRDGAHSVVVLDRLWALHPSIKDRIRTEAGDERVRWILLSLRIADLVSLNERKYSKQDAALAKAAVQEAERRWGDWLPALEKGSPEVRSAAAFLAARGGVPPASLTPVLMRLLDDKDPLQRERGMYASRGLKNGVAAVRDRVGALRTDADPCVRSLALHLVPAAPSGKK